MYISFSLTVQNVKTAQRFSALIDCLREKDLINYVFCDPYLNGETGSFAPYDLQRWDNSDEDMRDVSIKFPEMVFELSCHDDEGFDYKEYFWNGQQEECLGRLVFDKPKTIPWKD